MLHSGTAVLQAEIAYFCKVALEESEDYKDLINLCMIFLGWRSSCGGLLWRTRSIASSLMDGQSKLPSQVVRVAASVYFD